MGVLRFSEPVDEDGVTSHVLVELARPDPLEREPTAARDPVAELPHDLRLVARHRAQRHAARPLPPRVAAQAGLPCGSNCAPRGWAEETMSCSMDETSMSGIPSRYTQSVDRITSGHWPRPRQLSSGARASKERGLACRPLAVMPSAEGAAHLPPKTTIAYGPCRALVAPGERVRLHPARETCAVLARGLSQARTDPRQVLPTAPSATAGTDQHRRAATRCAFLCQARVVWPESLPSSRLTLPRVHQQRTWTSRDISVKDFKARRRASF